MQKGWWFSGILFDSLLGVVGGVCIAINSRSQLQKNVFCLKAWRVFLTMDTCIPVVLLNAICNRFIDS